MSVLIFGCVLVPPISLAARWATGSTIMVVGFVAFQLALLATALTVWVSNREKENAWPVDLAYLNYFVIMLLASGIASIRFPELGQAPTFTPLLMLLLWSLPWFVLPRICRDSNSLTSFWRAVDVLALICWISVVAPLLGVPVGEVQRSEATGVTRVFGLFGDSIALAIAFFLLQSLARGKWLTSALHGIALSATASFGGAIVAGVGALALWLARRSREQTQNKAGVLLSILGVVAAILVFGQGFLQRILDDDSLVFSLGSRIGAYLAALDVWSEHYWLGVGFAGLGTMTYRFDAAQHFDSFSENAVSNAFNQYLQSWLDAGVFGFIALLAMLFTACIHAWRANRDDLSIHSRSLEGSWAWLIGLCIGNQTSVWLLPHALTPFLFSLVIGISTVHRQLANRPRVLGTSLDR